MSASTPTASSSAGSQFLWLAAGALGLAAFAVFSVWTPPTSPDTAVCLLRRTTGLPCPGCGMTRGLAQLAKGNLAAAVSLHPLAPWLVAEVAALWLAWGAFLLSGRRFLASLFTGFPFARRWPAVLLAGNVAAFFLVWGVRWARGTLPW